MAHNPTPVQSFLGGIGLSIPVHVLLLFNGSAFGVSGFLHGTVRGSIENLASVFGLIVGGLAVGLVDGKGHGPELVGGGLVRVGVAGVLVGLGTKLAKGCTSGHMVSGISRLSIRSVAATATFFSTAVITSRLLYGNQLPQIGPADWSVGQNFRTFLFMQVVPLAVESVMLLLVSIDSSKPHSPPGETTPLTLSTQPRPRLSSPLLRTLTCLVTAFQFSIPLRLSNLVLPSKVVGFLLLPIDHAFDPSLAFLALGALPLSMLFYHFCRPSGDDVRESPLLGGQWGIPKGGSVDGRLVVGAVLFGIGWGLTGICPGPGLVNLGRAIATGSDLRQEVVWLAGMIVGGLLVDKAYERA